VGLLLGVVPSFAALPTGFVDEAVLQGLDQPVALCFLPDGRLLFTDQRAGRVHLVVGGQVARVDPVLIVPDVNSSGNEQGLLGLAVDPGWPTRPYLYVHYNYAPTSKIHIARFTVGGDLADPVGDSLLADPASRYDLLTDIPDNASNHNGGTVRFGPDGMLYVSLGEDATPCAAQDTSSLRGVILRLDVSQLPAGPGGPAAKSLMTPAGNPFSGPNDNARLTWEIGLRNPFRFHIDPATGDLFVADVGQSAYEEVDWATAGGMNFGWPFREGPVAGPVSSCAGITNTSFTGPIGYYDRTQFLSGAAVVSGGVYRAPADPCGASFPAEYQGDYFFAEYYQGFLRRLRNTAGVWGAAPAAPGQPNGTDWATGLTSVSDFAVGPEGALWYARQFDSTYQPNTGSIHRIRSADVAVRRPAILVPGPGALGPGDTLFLTFKVVNQGSCMRAHDYGLADPQGWVAGTSAPLVGRTPPLAPGDTFDLSAWLVFPPPCDTNQVERLVLRAYPVDFPDSAALDTTDVHCSATTGVLGVTYLALDLEGQAVRVRWRAADNGFAGFNVYRSRLGDPAGGYRLLNNALLSAAGGPDYSYLDTTVEPGGSYRYYVAARLGVRELASTAAEVTVPAHATLELESPRPNPSEGSTDLVYYLGREERVDVTVRDLSGRRVRGIAGGTTLPAGRHVARWDGRDDAGSRLPSGLYFIEVRAGGEHAMRRVAVVR
jgi:glucose/arabinose dehydrogenase